MAKILVTGAAGFIGFHVSKRLLEDNHQVVGLDNLNDYYDVSLKETRLDMLKENSAFSFSKIDLEDRNNMAFLFENEKPEYVIHLAAQAGVRYSIENPHSYIDSNIQGFINILDGCRHNPVKHLCYASSSSVYGANESLPFRVSDSVDHPVSLYAATKKANELMAHSYSSMYQIPTTGLRFFTVYGPWGRPDMALFLFTDKMLKGEPIDVYNYGKMKRDFTYIDDIVEGIVRICFNVAAPNPDWNGKNPECASSYAPYRVYNIGNNNPVELMDYIKTLEDCLGIEAEKNMMPIQTGDVPASHADVEALIRDVDYQPCTPVSVGIANFVKWYREYYGA